MLKKLPVGIITFLLFALTGVATASFDHREDNSGEKFSLNGEAQNSATLEQESGTNSSDSAQNTESVSSAPKKQSDEDSEGEIRQSSRGSGGDDEDGDDENEDDDDSRQTTPTASPAPKTNTTNTTNTTNSQNNTSPNSTTQAPSPSSSSPSFTLAQVATHNSVSSCYTAISGSVYDLTTWIGGHPGGSAAIKSLCGVDGTSSFNVQHGGQTRPANELAGFKIGTLVQ